MTTLYPNQTVTCLDPGSSVPGLTKADYVVRRISPAGYVWLKDEKHPSREIGPYVPTRFSPAE